MSRVSSEQSSAGWRRVGAGRWERRLPRSARLVSHSPNWLTTPDCFDPAAAADAAAREAWELRIPERARKPSYRVETAGLYPLGSLERSVPPHADPLETGTNDGSSS